MSPALGAFCVWHPLDGAMRCDRHTDLFRAVRAHACVAQWRADTFTEVCLCACVCHFSCIFYNVPPTTKSSHYIENTSFRMPNTLRICSAFQTGTLTPFSIHSPPARRLSTNYLCMYVRRPRRPPHIHSAAIMKCEHSPFTSHARRLRHARQRQVPGVCARITLKPARARARAR